MKKADALLNAALLFVVVLAMLLLINGMQECHARGGHYVRGLFWMECVR